MEHSNRRKLPLILIMTMPFTPFAVGADLPSHHEFHMDSEQIKVEIEASRQQANLELEKSTQALKQQMESYVRSETIWLELYHVRQVEMSNDIKELLRREGL
ncbi:hypothetical protein [Marinomonas gallaica]|uniref:hypothetical protein n=1 Tax=Marinomonas gallaica TaxID=1806667 RepID=UPI003A8FE68C